MMPLVTIYCLAYNHEKYIRQAIEGFLSQETKFTYEIIIHDDASTDKTADIINEYAVKYPNLIIPIIQKENQYSKGINIFKKYVYPLAKGKYIAVCEGDDYWCDTEKLQKQVDWLEEHMDYSLCAHNSQYVDCLRGKIDLFNDIPQDRDFTFEEILAGGKSGRTVFHTSSILFRREYAIIPDCFSVKRIGDYPRYLYLATCGQVRCLSDVMSVYRANIPNSWTDRMVTGNNAHKKSIEHAQDIERMLEKVDIATNGKYSEGIQRTMKELDYKILFLQGDIKNIRKKHKDKYKAMKTKEKIWMYLHRKYPRLANRINGIKRKLKI